MKLISSAILLISIIFLGCATKPGSNEQSNTDSKQPNLSQSATSTQSTRKVKIICPKCGKTGVHIVYGKPGRKTMKKAQEKKVYLGGCVKTPNSPKYHCYHCGNNW